MRLRGERRIRHGSEAREMARAEGWVMARHKGCMPFAESEKDWNALPLAQGMEAGTGETVLTGPTPEARQPDPEGDAP